MKKATILIILSVCCTVAYGQLDDTSSSSNGSMTLGAATGTLYQFAGDQRGTDGTGQSQGGFGMLSTANQISPIVWMFGFEDRNAFQVRKKGFGSTVQQGTTLFHVGANGKVGIGTVTPSSKLEVKDAISLYSGSNIGSLTLNAGTGTLFEVAGSQRGSDDSNQGQGGYGILRGANQISPIIWMYGFEDRNAFQVRKKGHNSTVQEGTTLFHVGANGRIGIGTTSPDSKLTVKGKIHSREVKVTVDAGGADFVFEDTYALRSLEETEDFIKENKHLPEIASEKEMLEQGLELGEMNIKLLQKIEELTLYLIEQNKKLQAQEERMQLIEAKNLELERKLAE